MQHSKADGIVEMLVQILALNDASSMPEGWGEHRPPAASPWTDISIYELHIRDFRSARCSISLSTTTCTQQVVDGAQGLQETTRLCTASCLHMPCSIEQHCSKLWLPMCSLTLQISTSLSLKQVYLLSSIPILPHSSSKGHCRVSTGNAQVLLEIGVTAGTGPC